MSQLFTLETVDFRARNPIDFQTKIEAKQKAVSRGGRHPDKQDFHHLANN